LIVTYVKNTKQINTNSKLSASAPTRPEQALLQPSCLTWSMTVTLDAVWNLLINCYSLYCTHR